jgi:hypothetical protein
VRARVAAGLFERVSEWNGWGRILLTATAGVEAQPDSPPGAGLVRASNVRCAAGRRWMRAAWHDGQLVSLQGRQSQRPGKQRISACAAKLWASLSADMSSGAALLGWLIAAHWLTVLC